MFDVAVIFANRCSEYVYLVMNFDNNIIRLVLYGNSNYHDLSILKNVYFLIAYLILFFTYIMCVYYLHYRYLSMRTILCIICYSLLLSCYYAGLISES